MRYHGAHVYAVADRVHGDTGVCRAFLAGASGSRSGKDRPRGRSGHPARSSEGSRAATDHVPGQGAGPAGRTADPPATQDERPDLSGDPEKLGARSDRRHSLRPDSAACRPGPAAQGLRQRARLVASQVPGRRPDPVGDHQRRDRDRHYHDVDGSGHGHGPRVAARDGPDLADGDGGRAGGPPGAHRRTAAREDHQQAEGRHPHPDPAGPQPRHARAVAEEGGWHTALGRGGDGAGQPHPRADALARRLYLLWGRALADLEGRAHESRMRHGRARGHPRSDERDDPHRGRERRASDPRTAACVGQAPEREAIPGGPSGENRQQTQPRPLRRFTRCSIVDSLFHGGAAMRKVRIAPSILSADFAHLADEIAAVEQAGADLVHVDVMDGHFVPNLTIGPPIVEALRKVTALPLDVHLMMTNPDAFIREFAEAGATYLTVHVETCPHLHRTVQYIKEKGVQAGVTLNPATPLTSVEEILPDVDLLLIMSVNPGFGGQRFIARVLEKIKQARAMIDRTGHLVLLEVDGGVKVDNAAAIVAAGADILVAGSAIFEAPGRDYRRVIAQLRRSGAAASDSGDNGKPTAHSKTAASSRKARR